MKSHRECKRIWNQILEFHLGYVLTSSANLGNALGTPQFHMHKVGNNTMIGNNERFAKNCKNVNMPGKRWSPCGHQLLESMPLEMKHFWPRYCCTIRVGCCSYTQWTLPFKFQTKLQSLLEHLNSLLLFHIQSMRNIITFRSYILMTYTENNGCAAYLLFIAKISRYCVTCLTPCYSSPVWKNSHW